MKKIAIGIALVPIFLLAQGFAIPAIAQQAYMFIDDQTGAPIKTQLLGPGGTPNAMFVLDYHHLISTAPPTGSGPPTGTGPIEHHPFVVTKAMDQAWARLFQAYGSQEVLRVKVMVFPGGGQPAVLEVELTGAKIAAMEPITIDDGAEKEFQRIRFKYGTIIFRDLVGGTETSL